MSKQALFYYSENLRMVQEATFTTDAGKTYGLGENGRDLLIFLCGAANEKREFCFHMGYDYMSEETGIHVSTLKRLMKGFEQLGWITRTGNLISHMGRGAPTVEYALTFYPPVAEMMRTGRPTSRPGATDNLAKPLQDMNAQHIFDTETEPETQTEPDTQPGSVVSKSARQEKAGINAAEVLRICIEFETESMRLRDKPIQPGLVKAWKADYPTIIAQAMKDRPGDTAEELAMYCHDVRTEARTGRPATGSYSNFLPRQAPVRTMPKPKEAWKDCPTCQGNGYYLTDPTGASKATSFCSCTMGEPTQVPTQERVSTDQGANTDIPAPGGSADPQSDARDVRDITGQLMRRLAQPIRPLPD
jgi:hypothetical protein